MRFAKRSSPLSAPLILLPMLAFAADPPTDPVKPYRIVDGKVDESTYLGWRAFHSGCQMCHGVGGTGTGPAPNLVERVKDLSAQDFTTKVLTSYRLVFDTSEIGDDSTAVRQRLLEEILRRERGDLVMPAWESSSAVRPHVLDIYAYLRARADGVLGPGTPQKIAN